MITVDVVLGDGNGGDFAYIALCEIAVNEEDVTDEQITQVREGTHALLLDTFGHEPRQQQDIEESRDASRPFPEAHCQACGPERYCGEHKYRWEYQQDEQAAHETLDALRAPRFEGPHPGDMRVLSVAGRIAALNTAEPS